MALMNDEFTDYVGKMVQITFGDEKGKVLVGTVKSAEEDHVVRSLIPNDWPPPGPIVPALSLVG